jgi:hypothetical protein
MTNHGSDMGCAWLRIAPTGHVGANWSSFHSSVQTNLPLPIVEVEMQTAEKYPVVGTRDTFIFSGWTYEG